MLKCVGADAEKRMSRRFLKLKISKKMKRLLVITLLSVWVITLSAQWQQIGGQARDIGVGANGTPWVVGWVSSGGGNYPLAKWNGNFWETVAMPGGAVRIDVGPNGNPWVVNAAGLIYRYSGSSWGQIGGQAHDVGIGADGTVWVVGWTNVAGGYNIAKWNGSFWVDVPGGAVRIDVAPDGRAWIVNDAGLIFRYNGSGWEQIGGQAHDISIGADGTPWVVGWTGVAGGYNIAKWNGSFWVDIPGALTNISVGRTDVWGTNSSGLISRQQLTPNTRVMTRFNPEVHSFRFRNDFITNFAGIDFSGLCGGMAYSALDYFNNNIPVPTQTSPPANGTPLRQYIYNRQQNATLDNVDKWGELSINPFGSRTNEFFNWGLQGFNGGRVQELRAEIDAGRPVPLGLYKGGNGGFVTHHQVLAIGYDMGRYRGDLGQYQEDLRIYVYDSNFPRQTKVLRPNLGNKTYYYESDPSCSWLTYFVDKKYRLASPPR